METRSGEAEAGHEVLDREHLSQVSITVSSDRPRPLHQPHQLTTRSEVIFKKSSNLYCRLDLGRVLMVGTKVSKGFFV